MPELSLLEQRILDHVQRPEYEPVKPRVIAKQLGMDHDELVELRRAVKRLVRQQKLSYGKSHLVKVPRAGKKTGKEIVGRFSRAAAGYGFVRPRGTSPASGRDDDIYVPAARTSDAADGDIVRLSVAKKRRGKELRWVGEVVEIIERSTHTFVGTYFESRREGMVQIDGNAFPHPISVGDPGAKNAQHGDKVVIEMVRFPTATRGGEAVISKVLGDRDQPGVDTQLVLYEFALPTEFPEAVLAEARQQADRFDESIPSGGPRRDLTDVTVLTIDPKDARDFDDAISLRRLENDHWRLGVHVADVSHFVPAGSELDHEARDRGTSVYLPDRVLPMLPEIISNNLASLQPQKVRYSKTAVIEFTAEGIPVNCELFSAAIRSDHRFTYEEVDDFLLDSRPWSSKLATDVFRLLSDMYKLAMILRKRRLERGAIELTLPEIKLELNKQGRVVGARCVERTESHQIIEEFMLAANEAVARTLRDRQWSFLRRVHDSPDPRKLKQLTEFVRELGLETDSLESRFAIKKLLAKVSHQPLEQAVNFAVLRSMQKAVYSPDDVGHYALASQDYCHFTSPIRRYPDLTIHRLIDRLERDQPPEQDYDRLAVLGDHCSSREQRAEKAERELIKLKLLHYMSQRIGDEMVGVVTGVESFGLFVQGIELPAEGLLHVESLDNDYYDYDPVTHSLRGRKAKNQFRLGDLLRVEIAHVDLDRREIDFRFLALITAAPGSKPGRQSKQGKEHKKSKTRLKQRKPEKKRKKKKKHGQKKKRKRKQ